ncbi:MAG: L-gulono-1,4-lactone oxidase (EC [uncultured Caballeronia sp.]|nr:MAG: L-gulono-1,4-lactone oxidase (EC [uncultured Caballeronia sp.]
MIMAAGPFIRGLMCYSAAEAAWLASECFDDIVVAYPKVEPSGLRAVAAHLRKGRLITLMVDSVMQVEQIDSLARAEDVVFRLSINLDLSSVFPGVYFGVYRSPVRDGRACGRDCPTPRRATRRTDGL